MNIRIFGGVASGKSTLAKFLGNKLDLSVFSTDDFVFTSGFKKKRSFSDREKLIAKTLKYSWIVEGVHYADWVKKTYVDADLIIVLRRSKLVLAKRIISRSIKDSSGRFNNKFLDTIKLLWMMFRDTSEEIKEYISLAEKNNIPLFILKSDDFSLALDFVDSINSNSSL